MGATSNGDLLEKSLTSTFVDGITHPTQICFQNLTKNVISVFWIDYVGIKKIYATIKPGKIASQNSFSTHVWCLEYDDGNSFKVLAEDAYIQLLPEGQHIKRPLQELLDDTYWRKPEWGQYRKRGEALGMDIMAYDCVCEDAILIAAQIVSNMLRDSPHDVVQRMVSAGCKVAIIGRNQVTSDIPAHHIMKYNDSDRDTDKTTRGLGATRSNPTTSCGEENLTMVDDCYYTKENILIHEFGHAVMNLGLDQTDLELVEQLYQNARNCQLYDCKCYMMDNADEYFAEACQTWFEATVRTDVNSGINTRAALKAHDPQLAALMEKIFGDGSWRYLQTAPGQFKCKTRPISGGSPKQNISSSSNSRPHRKFGGGLWDTQQWSWVGKASGSTKVTSRTAAGSAQSSAAATPAGGGAVEDVGQPLLLLPGEGEPKHGEDESKQKKKKKRRLVRLGDQVGDLVRGCFGTCME